MKNFCSLGVVKDLHKNTRYLETIKEKNKSIDYLET